MQPSTTSTFKKFTEGLFFILGLYQWAFRRFSAGFLNIFQKTYFVPEALDDFQDRDRSVEIDSSDWTDPPGGLHDVAGVR